MVAGLGRSPRLREVCQITEACWAVVANFELDTWSLGEQFRLSRTLKSELSEFVREKPIIAWLSGVVNVGRLGIKTFSSLKRLNCHRLYVFPVSPKKIIMVGSNNLLDARSQRVWKLLTSFENTHPSFRADEEVGLFQQTVNKLQQTQQELQSRISAQRETESRLIQAAKLVSLGELAAGVAHELNNPLTTIVGFTELALDELPMESSVRNDIELVLKEANRARSVISRLLDFARQTETQYLKADLNEIVSDVMVLTKNLMQTTNVQSVVRFGENLPWVSVDRNQIIQVIINLVNNALYAMPEGGGLFVETAEQSRFDRPWLTLSIRDTGVGIPQENIKRISEPFFTTRADHGGTGLGLSVSYGIVTNHGGMIEVESQVHVGSTFMVWLPLDQRT